MKKRLFFIVLLALPVFNLFGQGPAFEWIWRGTTTGVFTDAETNPAGVTIAVGTSGGGPLMCKFDASGNQLFSLTAPTQPTSLALDNAGNYYVGGISGGPYVAKFNSSGAHQWTTTLPVTSAGVTYAIEVDGSGNIYMSGWFNGTLTTPGGPVSATGGSPDVFLAKLNPSGTVQWIRTAAGSGFDSGYGIAIDGSGNVYLTGFYGFNNALSTLTFNSDVLSPFASYGTFLAAYNSSGGYLWSRGNQGLQSAPGYGLALDAAGRIIVPNCNKIYSAAGNLLLTAYTGSAVEPCNDGGRLIFTHGNVQKYSASDQLIWSVNYSGAGSAYAIGSDGNGNAWIGGQLSFGTYNFPPLSGPTVPSQIFLSKLNGCGLAPLTISGPATVCANSGGVTYSVTGPGSSSYNWTLPAGAALVSGAGTSSIVVNFSGFTGGVISVQETSSGGCVGNVHSLTVNASPALSLSMTSTPEPCPGASRGTVSATVTNGTPPYTYLWSNGSTSASLVNVPAGTYSVTVSDASGICNATASAVVTEPPALVATPVVTPATCSAGTDGAATVTVTGGTPGYSYAWSTGATSASVSGIAPGTYGVTVSDANGCLNIQSLTVGSLYSSPRANAGPDGAVVFSSGPSPDPSPCYTLAGSASLGTPPYTYSWSPSSGLSNPSIATPSACPTVTTTYTLTVTDANGCTSTNDVLVDAYDTGAREGALADASCNASGTMIYVCYTATCSTACVNKNANISSTGSLAWALNNGATVGACSGCKSAGGTIAAEVNFFPNPFAETGTLRITSPASGELSVLIADASGKVVKQFSPGEAIAGTPLEITVSAVEMPAGVYHYHVQVDNWTAAGKIVVIK